MFSAKHLPLWVASLALSQTLHANPLHDFHENTEWTTTTAASAIGNTLQLAADNAPGDILVFKEAKTPTLLRTKATFLDSTTRFEFLIPEGSSAKVFLHGRYAVELQNKNNEWQSFEAKLRAPRYDDARKLTDKALTLDVKINGETVVTNRIQSGVDEGSFVPWEDNDGPLAFLPKGEMALRHISLLPADFSPLTLPTESGGATNEKELVDFVAYGKDSFESVGCNACHLTSKTSTGVSSGPNLYGLFKKEPRNREVVEGGEGHRFTVKANREYLLRSIREPSAQLAVAEIGEQKGDAYLPVMPAFNAQVLSDQQIDAIGAYLATLNSPSEQGPAIKLMPKTGPTVYDPIDDRLQWLVNDEVRIQRGPLAGDGAPGTSGRAIHVGTPWSVNFTFDPRLLAVTNIWQGGFLEMSGEFLNRGGKGLKMGYESREISFGDTHALLAPLNQQGKPIDFSFKDGRIGDVDNALASLHSKDDHLDRVKAMDAQFLGYSRNSKIKQELPTFKYRVGKNIIQLHTAITATGDITITVSGDLKTEQAFLLHPSLLKGASTSVGSVGKNVWTLPAGTKKAELTASVALAANPWKASPSKAAYRQQPVRIQDSTANVPAGYRVESYFPPKDNFGRELLFEALGLDLTPDNTLVVATRTSGIWRMVKGKWHLFAEGTFDALGVLAEDNKGLSVVVAQKAELTRISDTNGDGLADTFETLFDAHGYYGNYHSYMHGPARGKDGAYYININLADGGDGSTYKAGGQYMGTSGGLAGWSIRVEPNGSYSLFANGLRSPAGLGKGPDGRLWYSENQGEYVGTSKIFVLEKDQFYGHPSGLVDLPGMTPDSPEIAWDAVKASRKHAVILLPHNRVANSPGHPAWDTTNGKFGPFSGQMLMGDQTQSNLLRISTQTVNGVEQGSVMPFFDGLESGVMRPLFLRDNSLLLGQTGRGWQAKGGHVASLQRITWDGKTVAPQIVQALATPTGFAVELTQPLMTTVTAEALAPHVNVASWLYRDSPDYGSPELDNRQEGISAIRISEDRKTVYLDLETREHPLVHSEQTARVYHVSIAASTLFDTLAPEKLNAYYTLYAFPTSQE